MFIYKDIIKFLIGVTSLSTLENITKIIDREGIEYSILHHPVAYTSQEIAAKLHISGKSFLKSVVLMTENRPILAITSAIHRINLEKLKVVSGSKSLRLATEEEITQFFPEYEVGAEPPFGNAKEMDVYLDTCLWSEEVIFFNAGTHKDIIKMQFKDLLSLIKPNLKEFSE